MNQWAASVQGLQDQYDILGELGRADDGALGLLARDRTTQQLVAVRVEVTGTGQTPKVVVTPALNSSVPATNRACPICKSSIRDWRRFCAQCGADLSGAEIRAGDAESRALLERVLQASQNQLELIGQVRRSEGGGAVYFGYERRSNRIVALDLRRQQTTGQQAAEGSSSEYSFAVTSTVERTRLFDPGAFSAGPTPLPPAPRLEHTPPPLPLPLMASAPAEPRKTCPSCGVEYDARTRFCPDDGSVLRAKGVTDDLIGEVIADRYHVLKKIGQGGMGQVYLAEHVRMGRRCAIKVMNRSLSQDTGAVSRFAREAANASRINDPNVAHIYDFGESKEHGIYLAMEYVEGEVLSRILERERMLPVERSIRIAVQVTRALAAAHKEGVVHRDLTPNNIVVGDAGGETDLVKVVDFGIAKAMQDSGDSLTRTGFVVGTPRYMSPEQLLADPVDGRSDLYSLGCIMFEMLVGTHPFVGPDGSHQTSKRLSEPPPHPRERNPTIPPALDAVVVKVLARNPAERFASAQELRQAMEDAVTQGAERKFSWATRRQKAGPAQPSTPSKPQVTPPAAPASPPPGPYSTPHDFAATVALGRIADELVPPAPAPAAEIANVTTPSAWAALDQITAGVTPMSIPQPRPDDKTAEQKPQAAGRPDVGVVVSAPSRNAAMVIQHGAAAAAGKFVLLARDASKAVQRGARVVGRGVAAGSHNLVIIIRRAGGSSSAAVKRVWPVVVSAAARSIAFAATAWRGALRIGKRGADAGWQGVSAGSRSAARLGKLGAEASARGVSAGVHAAVNAGSHGLHAGQKSVAAGRRGVAGSLSGLLTWWASVKARRRMIAATSGVAAIAITFLATIAVRGGDSPVAAEIGSKDAPAVLPGVLALPPTPPTVGRLLFAFPLPAGAVVKVNGELVPAPSDTLQLGPGDYIIQIEATGFETVSKPFTIQAGVDQLWSEPLKIAAVVPATPTVANGTRLTPLPRVKRPADANAAFVRAVTSEIAKFRDQLRNKAFDALRFKMASRELAELSDAINAAAGPFSVEFLEIEVADLTATRATFTLRIVEGTTDKTILAPVAYIAEFVPQDADWILESVRRVAR
jgi:serine/threonine protein kinase